MTDPRVAEALAWLKKHSKKSVRDGMARYAIPSDKALSVKLTDVHAAGADCIAVGCPFCYQQFDLGQLTAARRFNLDFKTPVINYLQLLGMALGFSSVEMQLSEHRVRVEGTSFGVRLEALGA